MTQPRAAGAAPGSAAEPAVTDRARGRFAEPPDTRTVVSTGGARLHTEIHGPPAPAPTVVLAHGWTCDTTFWDDVTHDLLADGHRVVRYDQRGHGRSPRTPRNNGTEELADDLCAVLAATTEPGERVVVGGHSMGGMTIVAAAPRDDFRERVAAAMLCSTGMGRLASEARVAPLRSVRVRRGLQRQLLASRLPLGPVTPVSRSALAYGTLGPGASAAVRERVARMVHACPRRTRAEWGRVLGELHLTDRLPALTVPTVVVHGSQDRLTPPVHAHRMAAALPDPGESPVLLDGLGHMTPMEAPERIAAVLRHLVRDHLARAEQEVAGADGTAGAGAVTGEGAGGGTSVPPQDSDGKTRRPRRKPAARPDDAREA